MMKNITEEVIKLRKENPKLKKQISQLKKELSNLNNAAWELTEEKNKLKKENEEKDKRLIILTQQFAEQRDALLSLGKSIEQQTIQKVIGIIKNANYPAKEAFNPFAKWQDNIEDFNIEDFKERLIQKLKELMMK